MICEACRVAGDLNSAGWFVQADMEHDNCKGCDCQHKVGAGWIWKPKPKKMG